MALGDDLIDPDGADKLDADGNDLLDDGADNVCDCGCGGGTPTVTCIACGDCCYSTDSTVVWTDKPTLSGGNAASATSTWARAVAMFNATSSTMPMGGEVPCGSGIDTDTFLSIYDETCRLRFRFDRTGGLTVTQQILIAGIWDDDDAGWDFYAPAGTVTTIDFTDPAEDSGTDTQTCCATVVLNGYHFFDGTNDSPGFPVTTGPATFTHTGNTCCSCGECGCVKTDAAVDCNGAGLQPCPEGTTNCNCDGSEPATLTLAASDIDDMFAATDLLDDQELPNPFTTADATFSIDTVCSTALGVKEYISSSDQYVAQFGPTVEFPAESPPFASYKGDADSYILYECSVRTLKIWYHVDPHLDAASNPVADAQGYLWIGEKAVGGPAGTYTRTGGLATGPTSVTLMTP